MPEEARHPAAQTARPYRKHVIAFVGIVALAALLYKFRNSITLEGFRWSVLGESLRHTRISLLLLSLGTIFVCYGIRSLRWIRFSQGMGALSFSGVFRATIIGFTSIFLLGRVGEPVRPLLIARRERVPVSGMFGVYVLERVLDGSAAAVFAGIALVMLSHMRSNIAQSSALLTTARAAGMVLLAGMLGVIVFLTYFRLHGAGALNRKLARAKDGHGWRAKLAMIISGFSDGLQGIRTFGDLAVVVLYTAVHWFLIALVYLWVPWSFGGALGAITLSGAMLVLAFTIIGSTLQLPGVGGGAQVASFLVFTVVFGIEKEPAAAAAILIWVITFAAVSIPGIPLLFHEGWSMGELKQLARAEANAEESGRHVPASAVTEGPGAMSQ